MSEEGGFSFFERLSFALLGEPLDRDQLLTQLREAEAKGVLDTDSVAMIEGIFRITGSQVREVMVPRSRMVVLRRGDTLEQMLEVVVDSAHSRFPVVGEDKDEVLGVLLAKDLLNYVGSDEAVAFSLRDILRPAVFVPESKRLNVLLREFRTRRNHMAIVVDEYGGVAGLVTIEDVLEEIVGEIADEHDVDDQEDPVENVGRGIYRVDATATVDEFNRVSGSELAGDDFDTVGGFVANSAGRVPEAGETFNLEGFLFRVTEADSRRILELEVERIGSPQPPETQ